jgi:hypothetical protein
MVSAQDKPSRQRMGEERIAALLQESLAVAVKTDAMKPQDTRRVIVDTTVQPKNVMFPTDAKLINRARERLVRLAKKVGFDLRQSYVRVGKRALIGHQRYAHAKQFKRAGKACANSGPTSAGSFAISGARSGTTRIWRPSSVGRSTRLPPSSSKGSASVAARSIACTPARWSASEKEKRTHPTSSG